MKTLFTDATVVAMSQEGLTYKYFGIENDKIIYLSDEAPDDRYDRVISLKDKYIYPTLTDSHIHLLYSIILSATAFNICKITKDGVKPDCIDGIKDEIEKYCKANPSQKLVMINQYIPSSIKEERLPYDYELDEWSNNKEVVVFNIDGHSCSLSSSLAKKLEIRTDNGILTGKEYDHNQGKITSYAASKVNIHTLAKGVANFTNECLSYGITKVCALDGDDNANKKDSLLSLLVFLARRMDIEVRLYPEYMNYDVIDTLGKKMLNKRIGGCAIWELDGSIGSHSASFYHPFKDSGTLGNTYYSNDVINNKIHEGLVNKYQMTCHAIGTKAIDQIVNAYKTNWDLIPSTGPMARIDHFEFPSSDAIDFVSNHRIAITVQPGYAYIDKRYIKSYEKFLSDEDLKLIAPLKTLSNNKVIILGSTDSPVQSMNPYDQIHGMVDYYDEKQSLTNYEALKTYTVNPSLALDENDGVLMVGKDASFFISNCDIIHVNKDIINLTKAEKVYIKGKEIKKKKGNLGEFIKLILRKPHKI